ncbi:hypothetical protein [Aliiglaciecola sp. LCG003]|uniref:HzsA-related protein n=1 Tax=Aliiglaciecola sp. LCG003 TaxID=3053655 RepID=UPI00257374D8|nr:hypothetical protein [Aliiglaciecola sp. LCG003]WJG08761.1 hypothetical protein QR722_15665 [Aliiglaciecola sp. LCG003]
MNYVRFTTLGLNSNLMVFAGACCMILLSGCGGGQALVSNNQQPDPVVVDIPIAYIKRALPLNEDGELLTADLTNPTDFIPGAAIYLKPRASASAVESNITDRAFYTEEQISQASQDNPLAGYDVKDLEVSYDGERLLFAMRAPEIEDADDDQQPSWNIWQYNRLTDQLSRLIVSDIVAEEGQDTAPVYLPDGRILFSSTRQAGNQAVLLDEGKPQYQGLEEGLDQHASVLHVMSANGQDIQQISFNQSHDLDATVLSNGKILFSRWDQAGNNNTINLYQMNADGSGLEIVYGRHSHNIERSEQALQFTQSRELADGRLLSAIRSFNSSTIGGDYVAIDIQNFIDIQQPFANQGGLSGPAQQPILFDNINIDGSISPGGHFNAVYPLWDGSERVLFSWSQCRVYDPDEELLEGEERRILPCTDALLANPDVQAAPLLFGLWMFDPIENTQLPIGVPTEGVMFSEVVAMESRAFPDDAQIAEVFSQDLADASLAQIHIKSVYDFAGVDASPQGIAVLADPTQTPVLQRPVQFIRVVKAVSIPDQDVRDFDNSAFGRSRNQLMREIIGYVPVQPDGSALFNVPANLPLAISLLDINGQRVSERHQNWMQFAPGEVKTCNGCHTQSSELPHGRVAAEAPSINLGAATTGTPFPNTNPVLFADTGETMAQTNGRFNGVQRPQADIEFEDIWTDPAIANPVPGFAYTYADLATAIPITSACATQWTSLCRIQINYPDAIQPIFELPRMVLAEDGISVLANHTCTSCHSPIDEAQMPQVPVAQLDLSGSVSVDNPDHLTSYRELMFTDNEQELLEGAIVDRLVAVLDANGDPVFEVDEDGELILDADGNPIAVFQNIRVANAMSTNGARSSARFFNPFSATGSHQSWLSKAELKLIAEWLDIGGQYYNNPFAAPAD